MMGNAHADVVRAIQRSFTASTVESADLYNTAVAALVSEHGLTVLELDQCMAVAIAELHLHRR